MIRLCGALLVSLLAVAPAWAQDQAEPQPAPQSAEVAEAASEGAARLTLGVGAAYFPDYEGSSHNRWTPIPVANGTVAGMSFTLVGNRAQLDVIPNATGPGWDIQFGPVAVYNMNRSNRDSIRDPRVRALGEVDSALEVGGYFGIGRTGLITSDFDKLSVTVSYRKDVTRVHRAGIWNPVVTYSTPLSTKAMVSLSASAEIVEDRYARTYFGVTPAQSLASGLPVFRPEGGQKDITFGGYFAYALTGNLTKGLSLVAGGTYRKLVKDFADSPLVSIAGDRNQWTGAAGLALTF
ncbi:outer membrane scaffolding protein for murein synthesis (MipA/OmpV family) [Sphingomonas kyeonggiensis]|uniref:MipA/OmpV family protein n=1 Tax=Sphingomonas kyeonggiensis TaxID=1268553 RepID=UPI00277E3813|nr:MipA/OmpV family protein [Sphingomonas kyeonggiensis]MDQ0248689.1 outer membrane scaffolding protein for murein synthesis (MipA/OmpV family) [Sphingomonas kyeonggiensis]